jgi:predicted XRE-type DNA-binding protein
VIELLWLDKEIKMSGNNWRDDPLENTPPVRANGDFLKTRGYPDPAETKIKFGLVSAIRHAVEQKKLRQVDVANMVNDFDRDAGMSQPDVSRILRGNVNGFSESRLMTILAALGNDVSIVVKPVSKAHGQITVREPALV